MEAAIFDLPTKTASVSLEFSVIQNPILSPEQPRTCPIESMLAFTKVFESTGVGGITPGLQVASTIT